MTGEAVLRPGVILDRDNTLIDVVRDEDTGTVHTAFHPSQLRLLPGVIDGLKWLTAAGYGLAIATNQPGPAKGQISVSAVERTNQALLDLLAAQGIQIAAFEVCLHHPSGGSGGDARWVGECACRKPKPGLLLNCIARGGFEPARTWMLGDSVSDVQAARAANVHAALLLPIGRCELCPLRDAAPLAGDARPDLSAARFDDLVQAILNH